MKKRIIALLLVLSLGLSSYGCGCSCSDEEETTAGQRGYTVYITDTGRKYHTRDCSHIDKSCHAIGSIDAKEKGYAPCLDCNP